MTDAPLPVLIAFAVLIGWPVFQAFVLVTWIRPKRVRLRATANALLCDPAYASEDDQRAINLAVKEARGSVVMAVAPVVVPLLGAAFAIAEMFKSEPFLEAKRGPIDILKRGFEAETGYPADGALWSDDRFRNLQILANDLAIESWPISIILTIVGLVGILPLFGMAYGVRMSTLRLLRTSVQLFASSTRLFSIVSHRLG